MIRTWLSRPLREGAGWAFAGQAGRAVVQMLFFTVTARALGPEEYGKLAATLAVIGFFWPFGLCGASDLMIRDVAREGSSYPSVLGRSILMWGMASSGAVVLAVAAAWLWLGLSIRIILALAVSEVVMVRLSDLAAYAFYAKGNVRAMGWVFIQGSLGRLFWALVLILGPWHLSAENWVLVYLLGAASGAAVSMVWLVRAYGPPRWDLRPTSRTFQQGVSFSAGMICQSLYTDLDKTVMMRMLGPALLGQYAVASRMFFIALMPCSALVTTAAKGTFRAGRFGVRGVLVHARRIWRVPLLGALGGAILATCASVAVPLLFGPAYASASHYLLLMVPVIVVRALGEFALQFLSGANLQGVRAFIQVGVVGCSLGTAILLVRWHGVNGAIMAAFVSMLVLLLACLGTLFWHLRRDARMGVRHG